MPHGRMSVRQREVADDRFTVVRRARTTNFVKLGVQQLLEPRATAAHARMMERHFEGLEFLEQ